MLSGKRVLVTKISQVEMPEEQKGLMGQICYPSRNFPIRLTEVNQHLTYLVLLHGTTGVL